MASTIVTKNSSTASAVPVTGDLTQGELAVNVTDKRLFTKNSGGTVVELGINPSSLTMSGGTANGVAYLNGSKVVTTGSALTFDGTTFQYTGAANFATSTGNVGIGTSSPGYKLSVSGASSGLVANIGYNGDSGTGLYVGVTHASNLVQLYATGSANKSMAFYTGATEVMRYDTSGNLGLGVTPSAWKSTSKALQINTTGGVSSDTTYGTAFSDNVYLNSSAQWIRLTGNGTTTGLAAVYGQANGIHYWYNAPVGSAGTAAALTQAMTLDASGNLQLGGTTNKTTGVTGSGSGFTIQAAGAPTLSIYDTSDASYYTNFTQINEVSYIWNIANGAMIFGTNNTERARIDSSGNLLVGTTGQNRNWILKNNASGYAITMENSSATSPNVLQLYLSGVTGGTGQSFINATDNNATRFVVAGNGNVTNVNNSYGAISDAKLKENVVDATPKLDGLMQVRVVNYNLIGDEQKQLGVVAQELEQVFPSLVDESVDRDKDGNDLGTTTKQVKYSVFVPMLIKAIQEQQAIIEQLKARLDAANL